jgi:hypothetical protein
MQEENITVGDIVPVHLDNTFEWAIILLKHPEKVLVCNKLWLNAYKVLFAGRMRWIHCGDIYNGSRLLNKNENSLKK